MCEIKVANRREDLYGNRGERGDAHEVFDVSHSDNVLDSLVSPLLSGLDREKEMSAMVSALAHVVAGDVSGGQTAMEGGVSGGDEQRNSGDQQRPESVATVSRGYTDFPIGGFNFGVPLGKYYVCDSAISLFHFCYSTSGRSLVPLVVHGAHHIALV